MRRIRNVDGDLRSLTAAIGIASSGLNAATGIHCSLSPITLVGDGGQAGELLIQLRLHNNSALRLPEPCNIVVKQSFYGAASTVHSFPLPQIAPGRTWATSLAVTSNGNRHPGKTTLVVSIVFGAFREMEPSLAVIHTFTVDHLHYLEATSQSKVPSDGFNFFILPSSRGIGTALHRTTSLRLALPKAVFGLSPDPGLLLRTLVRAGNHSLMEPTVSALSEGDPHFKEQAPTNYNRLGSQGPRVSIQGMLHALQLDSGPVGLNVLLPRKSGSGVGYDRTHAVLELECEAASLSGVLGLHGAVLRRFERMESAEARKLRKGNRQDVIIPAVCRLGAPLDVATLDSVQEQLEALRNHALRLKEEINGVSTVQCRSENELIKDVGSLLEQLRMSTAKLPIESI